MNTEIVLFGFNRPDKLRACLDSLARNENSSAYILNVFIDGARNHSELELTEKCANLLKMDWNFKEIRLVKRDINLGLAQSIIGGVSEVLESADSVIVLEDDLLVAPLFLTYMQTSLRKYSSEESVVSIHGYTYPGVGQGNKCFFLKGADCWGWATWRDRWKEVNWDTPSLIHQISSTNRIREFDLDNTANYSVMLEQQFHGEIDSWAIRWHASAYLDEKITLYPPVSFVNNVGSDGSGTHGRSTAFTIESFAAVLPEYPDRIEEFGEARERLKIFYKKNLKRDLWYQPRYLKKLIHRAISKLKRA